MHRPAQDPFGGTTPLVDRLIGNAFEVVKYVAQYVKEIRYVAFNMEHVYNVSRNLYEHIFLVQPIIALDSVVEIDLPVDVTPAMIINSSVNVLTAAGAIYGPSATTFTWIITGGKLVVTIPVDAPPAFVGADIRWLINWQSPIVTGV